MSYNGGDIVYTKYLLQRLIQLRTKKGVSARDMSLSIGQNEGYINNIENGKALPSMTGFFYICEYLNVTPAEFFDNSTKNPEKLYDLVEDLKHLDESELCAISTLVKGILKMR